MNQKVVDVYNGLVMKFKELISEHELNHDDYQALVDWADALGKKGEIPLFMDVFFETHALQEMYKNVEGTEPTILGPFYLEDAAQLEEPYVLPQRPDEPGDVLFFQEQSGMLRATHLPIRSLTCGKRMRAVTILDLQKGFHQRTYVVF